jgi:hypothetical protein
MSRTFSLPRSNIKIAKEREQKKGETASATQMKDRMM